MTIPIERPYEVLGKFISFTASFELFVNLAVEIACSNQKVVDHMHRQSMEIRIEFLRHNLFLLKSSYHKLSPTKGFAKNIQQAYDSIDAQLCYMLECYNKFKPYRDLVAHSPVMNIIPKDGPKKTKIFSSRRHKPQSKINNLDIATLSKLNDDIVKELDVAHKVIDLISGFCSPILEQSIAKHFT